MTMVLEAASDIRHAERTLRDIDLFNQQGASGAGNLESEQWLRSMFEAEWQVCCLTKASSSRVWKIRKLVLRSLKNLGNK